MEDKFFFEDISHLRRLNTDQMNRFAAQYGFNLDAEYYSNQFHGAIDWITLSSPIFILDMTDPKKAKDIISGIKLACLCVLLFLVKCMRFPANTIDYKRGRIKSYKYYILFLILSILYPLSKLTNIYLRYKSDSEWQNQRRIQNGSEMYLYYKRTQII